VSDKTAAPVPPIPPVNSRDLTRTIAPLAPLAVALVAAHLFTPAVSAPAAGSSAFSSHAQVAPVGVPVDTPAPLLSSGNAVDWWFVFKFNSETLPGCGGAAQRACIFGGTVQPYNNFGQQFAYASSANHNLQSGGGCVGDTLTDPIGATFDEVYNGNYFYVVWNDQFYGDPLNTESSPAGHSKGVLAWDNDGNGFVMQVSTPSWPGSGSVRSPRQTDGNTLGCVKDNDVLVSQHYFALKLNKDDVLAVLRAMQNSSVVTAPAKPETVNNGGPADIQQLANGLGAISTSDTPTKVALSSGVVLLSKPSHLHVPPWQMVSAMLSGEPLRVASWWTRPEIPTTLGTEEIGCWSSTLGKPGGVQIATSGTWAGKSIGLEGLSEPEGNHAKIGVSSGGTHSYIIFGDMNQQGTLSGNCNSSQNGRGGMFYVVNDPTLYTSVSNLLQGQSAPAAN
jgi:hypothetical protein